MVTRYEELTVGAHDKIAQVVHDTSLDPEKRDIAILMALGFDDSHLTATKVLKALDKAKFLSVPCTLMKVKTFKWQGFSFKAPHFGDITYSQYVDVCSSTDNVSLLHALLVPKGHSYNDGYEVDFTDLPYPLGASIIQSFMESLSKRSTRSLHSSLLLLKVKGILFKRFRGRANSLADTGISTLSTLSHQRWA